LEKVMSNRAASSSDLDLARILSQRLVGRAAPAAGLPKVAVPFVSFAASGVASALEAPGPEAVSLQSQRFESLDELLGWAMELTSSSSAFVMDPEGFAIATRGSLLGEDAQAVGAQLMVTMSEADRAEHPGTPALAVAVDYASSTLTGLRVERDAGQVFTIGFVATHTPSPQERAAVCAQMAHNLGHL
jgi:hypothetical protein